MLNNGVPTVWGFLLLGGIVLVVLLKVLVIDKRRPLRPGGIDSWSGNGSSDGDAGGGHH